MSDDSTPRPSRHPRKPRKVISLHHGESAEALISQFIGLRFEASGWHGGGETTGREQWAESFLHRLHPGEALVFDISMGKAGGLTIGAQVTAPAHEIEARKKMLQRDLQSTLALALPQLKASKGRKQSHAIPNPERWPHSYAIQPAGERLGTEELARLDLKAVPLDDSGKKLRPPSLLLSAAPGRKPDMTAVAEVLARPELIGCRLELRLSGFTLEPHHEHAFRNFLRALAEHLRDTGDRPALVLMKARVLSQFKEWAGAFQGLTLHARLHARAEISPLFLDFLCLALFGIPCRDKTEEDVIDLSTSWPNRDLGFLSRLPAILATQNRVLAREKARRFTRRNAVELGELLDGSKLWLEDAARAQHVYMCGGTGTGKSTLMLNMILRDIKADRGVVVIDPHGSLYDKVLERIPERRRADLVLANPEDPATYFTMNVLHPMGDGDPDEEQARIVDELWDFFRRTQWKSLPEAFGPMATTYWRNGLLLLLNVKGKAASVIDIQRVFSDSLFRRELLDQCSNDVVREFWRGIALQVTRDAEIAEIAPYIIAKITPIAGNAHMKRILGATTTSLNFREVIAKRQICLINLAQPTLGREASQFLGGILTSRLVGAAKAHWAQHPDRHRQEDPRARINCFMDEFQTYISANLADSLAEVRKFGLNLTLANQNLGQLSGDHYQANVVESVLGNAANLIAFRVGLQDALRLGMKIEPDLSPTDLARLPNFKAAAVLMRDGAVTPAEIFATYPEPRAPRRRRQP